MLFSLLESRDDTVPAQLAMQTPTRDLAKSDYNQTLPCLESFSWSNLMITETFFI